MTTRRGPDVARGPDVVHHCITGYNNISWRSHDRPAPPKIWGSRPLNPRGLPPMTIRFVVAYFNDICLRSPGLLIAVAPRFRYCSGATFTVAVAVAPLLLAESSGDSSAAT